MKYTIGEFSKIVDISEHTLRYYEKEKLIIPNRQENDRRYYTDKDISWIEFIKKLKDTRMPIKKIREYAKLRYEGDSTLELRMDLLVKHQKQLINEIKFMKENLNNLNSKIAYYKKEIDKK